VISHSYIVSKNLTIHKNVIINIKVKIGFSFFLSLVILVVSRDIVSTNCVMEPVIFEELADLNMFQDYGFLSLSKPSALGFFSSPYKLKSNAMHIFIRKYYNRFWF